MKIVYLDCKKKDAENAFNLWKYRCVKSYEKVKKRTCELCFTKENLQLHHIDGDKRNNNSRNLQTLCENCHREIHRKLKVYYIDRHPVYTHLLNIIKSESTENIEKLLDYYEREIKL
jgi:hypothetical protein